MYEVELNNNGCMEFDPEDGTIRYIDCWGNSENVWTTSDPDYKKIKNDYFPNLKIDSE